MNEPRTFPEWVHGMIEVRNVIGTGAGQQYEWTFKMIGMQFRGQSITVNYVRDECAAYQSIGMIESVWINIVEEHEEGTKLTFKVEYTIPSPIFGRLAELATLRRNKRGLDASLLNAKEVLEA